MHRLTYSLQKRNENNVLWVSIKPWYISPSDLKVLLVTQVQAHEI